MAVYFTENRISWVYVQSLANIWAVSCLSLHAVPILRMHSINPTYPKVGQRFTVASPVSSSMAARLRSLRPTRHVATARVRGAATYRAPGR